WTPSPNVLSVSSSLPLEGDLASTYLLPCLTRCVCGDVCDICSWWCDIMLYMSEGGQPHRHKPPEGCSETEGNIPPRRSNIAPQSSVQNEDDGNQAVLRPECEDFLCEYRQNMHNSKLKLPGRHAVLKPLWTQHQEACRLNQLEDSSAVEETIHHTFHSLRTQLDQREKELIIDLDNQTKQKLSNLHIEQVTSEGESERCKWTSDYIKTVLRYASELPGLSDAREFNTRNNEDLPQISSTRAAPFTCSRLQHERTGKLKSDISKFGSLVGDGSASDEHTLRDRGTQTDDIHLPDLENTLKHLKLPEASKDPTPLPQFDAGTNTYSLESGTVTTLTLQCPKLQLNAARTNTDWCHVTTVGQLVNSPPATQHRHSGRLRTYWGTCASTPIPLPPSPSTVTPVPHTPRYWETHSRVGVVSGGWWGWFVLEMGVVEESQVDSMWCVCYQHRSWCVSVERCCTHQGSLCTRVWQQGEGGKCYSNTMSDTRGTQATLHYGVVLDVGRGRLAFIDLDREVVLAKVDVEWSESLLPMFGVGSLDVYTVNMKVISGADITMTDTKKSLIYDALN
ncbi:uncharacterized protein LOC124274959, partial [Haliotis rubra]|uniref:uncharacterized protein LOC124274959 n=1 Tax=Haliotis rubra TaxID=36100 RepID=UPI001EE53AC4